MEPQRIIYGDPFNQPKPKGIVLEFIPRGGTMVPVRLKGYTWFMKRRKGLHPMEYLERAAEIIAREPECLARAKLIFGENQ